VLRATWAFGFLADEGLFLDIESKLLNQRYRKGGNNRGNDGE
jgi:hypothetical protein